MMLGVMTRAGVVATRGDDARARAGKMARAQGWRGREMRASTRARVERDRDGDAKVAVVCVSALAALVAVGAPEWDGVARAAEAATADNARTASDALFDLAGGEVPFWANMVKYARFSISIMVGFAYMFGRPVVNLMKKPQTAALVVATAAGGYVFFKFTIETMLGLNDPSTL